MTDQRPSSTIHQQPPSKAYEILQDCRTMYLAGLDRIARAAGVVMPEALEALRTGAGGYYDDILAGARRSGFEMARGLTSSRITLVGEDDLELEIHLDEMGIRLMERCNDYLWPVYLRFITLLNRPDLDKADNPVGPDGFCVGFTDMCVELNAPPQDAHTLVERLEAQCLDQLPDFYRKLNDFLHQQGVEAAQPRVINRSETSTRPVATATPSGPAIQAGSIPAGGIPAGFPLTPASSGPATTAHSGAAFSLAPTTLSPTPVPQATRKEVGPLTAQQKDALSRRLSQLEKAPHPTESAALERSNSLSTLIPGLFADQDAALEAPPRAFSAAELEIPAGTPEAIVVDDLLRIFGAITHHPHLAETLKASLETLHLPLIRQTIQQVSLVDAALPGLKDLLNRVVRVALGIPRHAPDSHPVCQQLAKMVHQLRDKLPSLQQSLVSASESANQLLLARESAIASAALAYAPLLQRLERSEAAQRRSQQTIRQFLARGVPSEIGQFLDTYWQQVLTAILLEHGDNSPQWTEHVQVVETLLWSTSSRLTGEDRKRLAGLLPGMLACLNAGMARVNMPATAREAFLDTCFTLQTASLRASLGKEGSSVPATYYPTTGTETPQHRPLSSAVEIGELRVGDLLLRTLELPGGSDTATTTARVTQCNVGDWVEFILDGKEPRFGRLSLISSHTRRLMFFNPDWGFAISIHPLVMDRQFREGKAQHCGKHPLF